MGCVETETVELDAEEAELEAEDDGLGASVVVLKIADVEEANEAGAGAPNVAHLSSWSPAS